jgi:hypothetical protein
LELGEGGIGIPELKMTTVGASNGAVKLGQKLFVAPNRVLDRGDRLLSSDCLLSNANNERNTHNRDLGEE